MGYMKKSILVRECMHRFCERCITDSIRLGKNECPTCRVKIPSRRAWSRDERFDELIKCVLGNVELQEELELQQNQLWNQSKSARQQDSRERGRVRRNFCCCESKMAFPLISQSVSYIRQERLARKEEWHQWIGNKSFRYRPSRFRTLRWAYECRRFVWHSCYCTSQLPRSTCSHHFWWTSFFWGTPVKRLCSHYSRTTFALVARLQSRWCSPFWAKSLGMNQKVTFRYVCDGSMHDYSSTHAHSSISQILIGMSDGSDVVLDTSLELGRVQRECCSSSKKMVLYYRLKD